ncbi:hypothetical protein [Nesterenkonia sp. PF2B19]|uniref:hypothetical protein n=1 Tax=Nesterenkonia sp. PF2B19 TaxID=1881858 RepID=UPI000871F854|nr:hypothetical protein [Nesterenkonia sp. PF2B19]OSM43459.1 hypothetical protein BCY76_008045 [Nesterenkonia sp. PF2B19]
MTLLSKSDILGADDLPTRDVEVPEWGGTVRVRGLTGQGRDAFEMKMAASRKNLGAVDDVRASLAAKCIVGEDGERMFTDKEVVQLGRKSGAALDRVYGAIRELSGMDEGAAEEAVEDFGEAAGGDSPSD